MHHKFLGQFNHNNYIMFAEQAIEVLVPLMNALGKIVLIMDCCGKHTYCMAQVRKTVC